MQIVEMPVSDVLSGKASYNPRTLSKAGKARLRASLEEFGLVQPLIWNRRSQTLVSGHMRLDILAENGADSVSVVQVDLDPAQERLLNIQMNRDDFGDWDRTRLDELLLQLGRDSGDLLGALKLTELPEFRASDTDRLLERILEEKEWTSGPHDVDPNDLAEQLASKIRSIPQGHLGGVSLIAVTAGAREVLILTNDPSLANFASEVRHAAESGSPSPLADLFSRFV